MPEQQAGGNFFTAKLGPLPVWVWALIVIAALGAYAYWKKIGPFAADNGAGAYPSVDPSSLGSMLGAGASPNLGVLQDGGPSFPAGGVGQTNGSSSVWFGPASQFREHIREYTKLHPGAPAPVYGGVK